MNLLFYCVYLLTEKFDGDRFKVRSFIKQVDSVFEVATERQKPILLLYVKSLITGKAREQIDIHCNLTTWPEISELLLNLYHDKKSLDQLLEELHMMKQGTQESVASYYQRLEDLSSKILGTIHSSTDEKTDLSGRISMVTQMTLNRFIFHSIPPISQMLRYKAFKTINEAFTAAVAEEKALKLNTRNPEKNCKCSICNRTNHNTEQCF